MKGEKTECLASCSRKGNKKKKEKIDNQASKRKKNAAVTKERKRD